MMVTAKKTTTKAQNPVGLEFWESVCKTDPAITKKVQQKGGFTAIDAQVQIKNATAVWGPYGGAWGVKDCVYEQIGYDTETGTPHEVALDAVFYCPQGEFEISTDIAWRKGGDSRKKLLTDLTTKALSKLGFNSDVFEGKFDDNKYVAEMRKEFSGSKPASKSKSTPTTDDNQKFISACMAKVDEGVEFFESIGHENGDAKVAMGERVTNILTGMKASVGQSYKSYHEIEDRTHQESFYRSLTETVAAMIAEMDGEEAA
jgi:hypothetical protein